MSIINSPTERKIAVTLTIHKSVWKTFQDLTKDKKDLSASAHVELLVEKANAEMSGMEAQPTVNFAALQNQHDKLINKEDQKRELLEKHGTFKDLKALLISMGLDLETYAQANKVIGELLKAMQAKTLQYTKSDIHLLIDLIEIHVKKCEILRQLDDTRCQLYLKEEEVTEPKKPHNLLNR